MRKIRRKNQVPDRFRAHQSGCWANFVLSDSARLLDAFELVAAAHPRLRLDGFHAPQNPRTYCSPIQRTLHLTYAGSQWAEPLRQVVVLTKGRTDRSTEVSTRAVRGAYGCTQL